MLSARHRPAPRALVSLAVLVPFLAACASTGTASGGRTTARPGKSLDEIQKVIDEEIDRLAATPAEPREIERVRNQIEATFLRRAERVGGMYGKADQLNAYYTLTGTPDFFEEDLARYRALDATDLSSAVRTFLPRDRRVELTVMPEEKK